MSFTFRNGFIGGAIVAVAMGVYLFWLLRPDHQVELNANHFIHAIEERDWNDVRDAIAADYSDDWGDDRERVLERMREVVQFTRHLLMRPIAPITLVEGSHGLWTARIEVNGDESELMVEIKQRINPLTTPFKLEWRQESAKPWDWKLVHVSNRELVL